MTKYEEHLITNKDLKEILDYAKYLFPITTFPIKVSRVDLSPEEAIRTLLVESILVHLNKNGLLNKTVKIDYK